jgi:lipoate-protein ligase A
MSAPSWRLLVMGADTAAANMAIDESLLRHARTVGVPTLRLYGWKAAAFSYGYFTDVTDEFDIAACRESGVELVRRPTGGGIVVHRFSLTYTVVVPPDDTAVPSDALDSYRFLNGGVARALKRVGFPAELAPACDCADEAVRDWCFARTMRHDVVMNGSKLAGAAQRRNRFGLLHQGYLTLRLPDADTLRFARKDAVRLAAAKGASVPGMPGSSLSEVEMRNGLVDGFAEALSVRFEPASLSGGEVADAERLRATLYHRDDWNFGDRTERQRLRRSVDRNA